MRGGFRDVMPRLGAFAGLFLLVVAMALNPVPHSTPPASAQGPSPITLSVDAPEAGASAANGQRFFIGGWAAVPGATTGNGISMVDIFLDTPFGSANQIGTARLGIARPDVALLFGQPSWGNSGFNFDWVPRNVPVGPHTIYVVVRTFNGDSTQQAIPVTVVAGGAAGSFTNPAVTRVGQFGYELDTGGPGVFLERPNDTPSR